MARLITCRTHAIMPVFQWPAAAGPAGAASLFMGFREILSAQFFIIAGKECAPYSP